MSKTRRVISGINALISLGLGLVLAMMLVFAGYALWDTWVVYKKADVGAEIMHYQPVMNPEQEDNPSLLELAAINPDVKAWVTLENTNISYPVLHSKDNSYYLTRDFYGEHSVAGSVFLDYQNDPNFGDLYSVLYGHNMSGGAMFADLLKYGDAAFFEENRTGYLFLPDKTYQLEIFAYLHVDAYETPAFRMVYGAEEYQERLDYIREAAIHYRDIGVSKRQQILVLSTCSSAVTNDRSIVVARMQKTAAGGEMQTP